MISKNATIQLKELAILYIDSDAQRAEHFKNQFRDHYTIFLVDNLTKARAILNQQPINAIVGFNQLNNESIIDFYAEIRLTHKDIFRIFIHSGESADILLQAVNKAHVYHVFKEDYTTTDFTTILQHACDKKIREQAITRQINQIEIRKASEQAENANRLKSQFLASMSHEIRTPLNGIIGLAHLLEKTSLNTKQDDYLAKINVASHNMLAIINDILDLSKIEAGKFELELSDFNLKDVFKNVNDIIITKENNPNVEIITSIHPEIPTNLIGDPLRLSQVLLNLVNNASKFTKMGEIIIGAELIDKSTEKVTIRFSVMDTGIGLTEEQQDKVFEAFNQADSGTASQYGGTGLGLTISRLLVGLMDGKINVNSALGQGSTFYFDIELARSTSSIACAHHIPDHFKGLKVLVVDDNITVQKIFTIILESFSFDVTVVSSGEEALDLLELEQKTSFDLIIFDWQLPGKTGIECIKIIQQDMDLPSVPIMILVSAYDEASEQEEFKDITIDGFLLKPVTSRSLKDTILKALSTTVVPNKLTNPIPSDLDIRKRLAGQEILVVEDNSINQQIAREFLESWDIAVTTANNGKQAVSLVKQHRFDLVLMDIQMPVLNGLDATKAIRKWERQQQIKGHDINLPIVAMTAFAMSGDKEKSLAAGMTDHLTKPLEPDNVLAVLLKSLPEPKLEDFSCNRLKPSIINTELPTKIIGIDQETAMRRLAGNTSLYKSLLIQFASDYRQICPLIGRHIKEGNLQDAAKLVHTLKGVAGNIGALELVQIAITLDEELRKNGKEAAAYFKVLEQKLLEIQDSLAKNIPELAGQVNKPENQKFNPLHDQENRVIQLRQYITGGIPEAKHLFYILKPHLLEIADNTTFQLQEKLEQDDFDNAKELYEEILGAI
jgi:signal transduction histidine kinase/CheY-like chemotaxis protein